MFKWQQADEFADSFVTRVRTMIAKHPNSFVLGACGVGFVLGVLVGGAF